MAFEPQAYEKLGSFYLGRPKGADGSEDENQPFLYDSSDLTTHAVCVGMTGSGKTGLCISLLEEAAIDGIPALIIDPKGDLTNLALQFPALSKEEFQPWISLDEANRANLSPDAFAQAQADLWKSGLARWGQDGERIRLLQQSAEVVVFTPGSTAGVPVSILSSFAAPPKEILEDHELLSGQIETTVQSLLGLLGIRSENQRSREATFLGTLLQEAWSKGESLTLEELAHRIQTPPFQRVGVLDTETFYPAKDRFSLLLALNNLLASPGFAVWRQGVPLDVRQLLYTPEGKPRLAVLSIAHLSDQERMFFVSLLLGATLSWMRRQPGTSSLRALLYMDEVFGYFPPTANPPSKLPLLTLMKQARAFGLGVVLATQNPADLDYKGLSNAGTWFIGRLQTERDKLRLLDGLAGMGVDRARIDAMLGRLGKRVFLMNNVHEEEPVLFETRWVLSYLRGPMTREQIRQLPRPASSNEAPPPAATPPAAPTPPLPSPRPEPVAAPETATAPLLPGVRQIFPKKVTGDRLTPTLVGVATLRFRDVKAKLDLTRDVALSTAFPDDLHGIDWAAAEAIPLAEFHESPPRGQGLHWEPIPTEGSRPAAYKEWEKEFLAGLIETQTLTLLECEALKLYSNVDEPEGDFRIRIAHQTRETRDERIAALKQRYRSRLETAQRRVRTIEERLRKRETAANQGRIGALLSSATALFSLFTSRKKISATNMGRASTAARGITKTFQSGDELSATKEQLEAAVADYEQLQETLQQEVDQLSQQLDALTIPLTPREVRVTRTGSRVQWMALGWRSV